MTMEIKGTNMTRRRFAALAGTGIIAAPAIIGRARAANLIQPRVPYDAASITTTPTYYGVINKISSNATASKSRYPISTVAQH